MEDAYGTRRGIAVVVDDEGSDVNPESRLEHLFGVLAPSSGCFRPQIHKHLVDSFQDGVWFVEIRRAGLL